jgi:hypothetical protein
MFGASANLDGLSSFSHASLARGWRRTRKGTERYAQAGVEPRLDDLLNDPLTLAIMARDGVSPSHLHTLIGETRQVLRHRRAGA